MLGFNEYFSLHNFKISSILRYLYTVVYNIEPLYKNYIGRQ